MVGRRDFLAFWEIKAIIPIVFSLWFESFEIFIGCYENNVRQNGLDL